MKFLFIALALTLLPSAEARKFDHVRKYLAEHDKSSKPIIKRSVDSWLKNSNAIGLGYNPLYGSPVCYTGVCQGDGFQHSVIKLNYVQPAIGSCTSELIPDFVELQCIPSADLQTSTEMISTVTHLSDSTFKRVEFGVDVRYRRFSASYMYSKETRSMIDQMMSQNSTATYTRGEVTFGKLRMFEPFMELSDTFRYVIEEMPCCSEYNLEIDEYIKEFLIDYFGLTFVTELILGGIAQETLFIGNKQLEEMQLKGEEVIRAASIGFFLNFNIKPTPPYNDIQQKQFMETVNTRRSTKLGGDPSAQTMDDWIKSVPTNPVIMNYAVKETTNAPFTPVTPVTPFVPNWDVEKEDGIRDVTKLNILSTLKTLIDTYGKSKKVEIALDVKKWLDGTYTGTWAVIIGDIGQYGSALSVAASTYFVVNETKLGWHIVIARTD